MNDVATEFDIGPLTWVKNEIDLALARARQAFQQYASSLASGAGDTTHIRFCCTHLHQVRGALTIVGLDGVKQFCEAIESLLESMEHGQITSEKPPVSLLLTSIDAIGNYLDDLLAGQPEQALRLLPVYEQIQQARGIERVSPTDLFFPNLDAQLPKRSAPFRKISPELFQRLLRQERGCFQRGFLAWLKNPTDRSGINEMLEAVQRIESTQETSAARAFWWVADRLLSALAAGALSGNFDVKQLCARIDMQIRKLSEGTKNVAERLMRDLLYFVAQTDSADVAVQQVKDIYRLERLIPEQSTVSTTPREIIRRKLREVISITGEAWNKYCAGSTSSLPVFQQHAQLLASTVDQLGQTDFRRLAQAIASVANWLADDASRLSERLAMETATAILLAQNGQKNFQLLGSDFAHQVDITVARIHACFAGTPLEMVAGGAENETLDEMSSRAQEKLLIEQVAKEIKINLGQIEHILDDFFRDADKRAELENLEVPMRQIAGALTMMHHDGAVAALDECLEEIRRFSHPDYIPDGTDFERIANRFSVIGLFIDAIPYGTVNFASFAREVQSNLTPSAVAGVNEEAGISFEQEIEQKKAEIHSILVTLKEKPSDESLRAALKKNLETLQKDVELINDTVLGEQIAGVLTLLETNTGDAQPFDQAIAAFKSRSKESPAPSAEALQLLQASDEKIDAELLGIFLDEAREVLATVNTTLAALKSTPGDSALLTTIRRSFHTLKGSGRMVGLRDLGEVAWTIEQVLNLWLRRELEVIPPLFDLVEQAHAVFSTWVAHFDDSSIAIPDSSGITALARNLLESFEENDEPAEESTPPLSSFSIQDSLGKHPATPAPQAPVVEPPPEMSSELNEIFRKEAGGYLEALLNGLRDLEQDESRPTPEPMYRAAHTLAGISTSVGLEALSRLASAMENALGRREHSVQRESLEAIGLVRQAVNEIDQMLSFFDGGQKITLPSDLIEVLDMLYPVQTDSVSENPELSPAQDGEMEAESAETQTLSGQISSIPRQKDEIDEQLLPVFLEEAADLNAGISAQLRLWRENPDNVDAVNMLARLLHTLKGSARMTGAMTIGQITHILEAWVENTLHERSASVEIIDEISDAFDNILKIVERLQKGETTAFDISAPEETINTPVDDGRSVSFVPPAVSLAHVVPETEGDPAQQRATFRVRAALVDQLVNETGELSIARAQIESEMRDIKDSLIDLTENVTRLRRYLREIHIQAESQMQSRTAQADTRDSKFDPLEFDRFTRFQELTRMMAESVNDVNTVQQNLLKNLDSANSALLVQSRLNKDVQWDLMTMRMLPFGTIKERLYRIVRQTSKELNKRVNLEIHGEQVEVDRSVLDKLVPPLEHLLRNAIVHGIEDHETRLARNKPEIGEISLSLKQEGNEIILRFADDGAGLDLERIRKRAIEAGLLDVGQETETIRLEEMIFVPGFSTVSEVSQIAGRGIGMDVVKTEVSGLGGRIETRSNSGEGTEFHIFIPLTLALTQIVLLRAGSKNYALPSPMVEQVLDFKENNLARIRKDGYAEWIGTRYPLHYLPHLLGDMKAPPEERAQNRILLLRSGMAHIALEVDEIVGSREIIVKNIGPQLIRVVGLDSATVLANGQVVLILNPVALSARAPVEESLLSVSLPDATEKELHRSGPPTVLVVDDSLTIRKITNRMLSRNGYQTMLARDGVEAMELLRDRIPDVMLVDIEMPRMDGFELTRAVRASDQLKAIPIIMITSRTAEKHRNHAFDIGVNHFLGKPFQEDEVLKLVAHHTARGQTEMENL